MNPDWESLFAGSLTLSDNQTESNALAELPARRGVLLFTDRRKHPIQLLQTANLRGLSRSRLSESSEDAPHRKADLGAITHHLYYACCANDFERLLLYQRLTHAVFGSAWKQWLALPRREYAVIDRSRPFAYFSVTPSVAAGDTVDSFGPFPTRRAAAQFCDGLNRAFELCRNPALLDSGNAQSCPYLQMQSCHGLCCREHGPARYTELIEQAVRCAEGSLKQAMADCNARMKQAAAALQFEAAQQYKKQAEHLNKLLGPDYAWTGRLNRLRILFVDRGEKIAPEGSKKKVQHYHLWRIDSKDASLLGAFAENSVEQLQALLDAFDAPATPYPYAQTRQEHLATIGYLLYRKSRPGLWFNAADALPTVASVLAEMAALRAAPSPQNSDKLNESDQPKQDPQ